MSRSILLTLCFLMLSGCFGPRLSQWEESRLEAQTADDLDNLLGDLGQISGGIDAAGSGARGDWDLCVGAYAGCRACYEASGTLAAGTLSMVLDGSPCTASLTLNDVRYEYTLADRQWSGTWEQRADLWFDVAWSGVQEAALTVEGHDTWDGVYDSSFTMNAATAVVDGEGNNKGWTVDYAYDGFLDRAWTVAASKDEAGVVEGTVASDDGISCALSGQDYDYVLDCQ